MELRARHQVRVQLRQRFSSQVSGPPGRGATNSQIAVGRQHGGDDAGQVLQRERRNLSEGGGADRASRLREAVKQFEIARIIRQIGVQFADRAASSLCRQSSAGLIWACTAGKSRGSRGADRQAMMTSPRPSPRAPRMRKPYYTASPLCTPARPSISPRRLLPELSSSDNVGCSSAAAANSEWLIVGRSRSNKAPYDCQVRAEVIMQVSPHVKSPVERLPFGPAPMHQRRARRFGASLERRVCLLPRSTRRRPRRGAARANHGLFLSHNKGSSGLRPLRISKYNCGDGPCASLSAAMTSPGATQSPTDLYRTSAWP